ncbi:MAG: NAD-dependent epimerase/dehydratase family protein, partial [Myxococcales bacterium]|nr:NAD-dependent epimerase/dehydratase family protein [Myxococcales bacterium]
TGATGFIGTHLTRELLNSGHEVLGLVRAPAKIAPDLRDSMEVLPGDLSIFRDPNLRLPPCDVVVHLAAPVTAPSARDYDQTNRAAVEDLLGALSRQVWKPRRLLLCSSLAAAGPSTPGRPHTEDDPLGPIDWYGQAKAGAEALVDDLPYPVTILRPCIVLGAGDPATLALFKMARTGFALRPAGPPQEVSFVDVADVVTAIAAMAGDAGEAGHVYFIAQDGTITVDEMLAAMGAAQGKRVRVIAIPRAALRAAVTLGTAAARVLPIRNQLDLKQYKQMTAPAFACSSARLQRELGWKPVVGLAESVERAAAGYRAMGWL